MSGFTGHLLRARLLGGCMLCVFALLGFRLYHLQYAEAARFQEMAARQQGSYVVLAARPGNIVDSRGRTLAASIEVDSVFADPAQIEDRLRAARALGGALGLDASSLLELLERKADKRFVWIKRRVSRHEATTVRWLGLPDRWVGTTKEFLRVYPQGMLACHVLGHRDIDNVGRDGVERRMDAYLRGQAGRRYFLRDARRRVLAIDHARSVMPVHGKTVVLTIDSVIQHIVEEALDQVMAQWKPTSASAVVMDPTTGEVLALANRPAFDPNRMADYPAASWRNRAIMDIYEPGSTFKPFVASIALDRGLVSLSERFFCHHGVYAMGRRRLHDHHPYGWLSFPDVIIKSSNIGMAQLGERLGNARMYEGLRAFGFGHPTGIDLPGETAGQLHPLARWTSYSTGSIPMGQEIGLTPIQLARAWCALANSGRLLTPKTCRGVTELDGTSLKDWTKPTEVGRALSAPVARTMVDPILTGVVEQGTGRRARLTEYRVWGKTGTAQKRRPDGRGYSHHLHVSSFVAGAPAHDPKIVVVVMVNEPTVGTTHYGGTVAAPAVGQIIRKGLNYLQVAPDALASAAGPSTRN